MKKKLIVILSIIIGLIALITGLVLAGVDIIKILTSGSAIFCYVIFGVGGILFLFSYLMRKL